MDRFAAGASRLRRPAIAGERRKHAPVRVAGRPPKSAAACPGHRGRRLFAGVGGCATDPERAGVVTGVPRRWRRFVARYRNGHERLTGGREVAGIAAETIAAETVAGRRGSGSQAGTARRRPAAPFRQWKRGATARKAGGGCRCRPPAHAVAGRRGCRCAAGQAGSACTLPAQKGTKANRPCAGAHSRSERRQARRSRAAGSV